MHNKIVAKYLDGKVLKGISGDFFPDKEMFHISFGDTLETGETITVNVSELKAVFFVKDFEGNKEYTEKKDFNLTRMIGRKVKVKFHDGEEVWGYVQGFSPEAKGFFLFPTDPKSNNTRIYVLNKSVESASLVE